jgi:hypothetical protein
MCLLVVIKMERKTGFEPLPAGLHTEGMQAGATGSLPSFKDEN